MAFTVVTLSMINEDTLETQMGTTIFAFFLSLYLSFEYKPLKLEEPPQTTSNTIEYSDPT
jgi:hypothetical protein